MSYRIVAVKNGRVNAQIDGQYFGVRYRKGISEPASPRAAEAAKEQHGFPIHKADAFPKILAQHGSYNAYLAEQVRQKAEEKEAEPETEEAETEDVEEAPAEEAGSEEEVSSEEVSDEEVSLAALPPAPDGYEIDYHEARQELLDAGVDLAEIAGKTMPKKADLARIHAHYLG